NSLWFRSCSAAVTPGNFSPSLLVGVSVEGPQDFSSSVPPAAANPRALIESLLFIIWASTLNVLFTTLFNNILGSAHRQRKDGPCQVLIALLYEWSRVHHKKV